MEKQQQDLLSQQQKLEEARVKLKQKFIGIDKQIDQVIDACTSWYLLPQHQERPVIINLWGMTGTGKTDMVQHLIDHINFSNFFFPFDMSSGNARWDIDRSLSDFRDTHNGQPLVLLFDEFQNARGITEEGKEAKSLPLLWKLLDSGSYSITSFDSVIYGIKQLCDDLLFCMQKGVRASNGLVTKNLSVFQRIIEDVNYSGKRKENQLEESQPKLVPRIYYSNIFRLDSDKFAHLDEVEGFLMSLNERETVVYLTKLLKRGPKPKTVDCSKALIFVLGNLDEAYSMASDFSVELDADMFHRESLKIDMLQVKSVLRSRFRFEQIARLGNNHIIYPALSKQNYRDIIASKLDHIAKSFEAAHSIKLCFKSSIHNLLYSEGVYPTQGTRPVLSTIQNLISDKLSLILIEAIRKGIKAERVDLHFMDSELIATYLRNDELIHRTSLPILLQLKPLRNSPVDAAQAITAVHEAGHAVVSIIAEGILPELVNSHSIDTDNRGFIYINRDRKFWSHQARLNMICTLLAGREAERMVFGDIHFTLGAENDISRATSILSSMFRKNAMGQQLGSFSVPGDQTTVHLRGANDIQEQEIKTALEQASQRARLILEKEQRLLLNVSAYLADHNSLDKDQLQEIVEKHATQKPSYHSDFDYRKTLFNKLKGVSEVKAQSFSQPLILNKNQ